MDKIILKVARESSKIVIIGGSRSGKTPLSEELGAELAFKVIHTDDFIKDFVEDLKTIKSEVKKYDEFILEGVQAVRVLRSGVREGDFFADLVIDLGGYDSSQGRGLKTILEDYKNIMRNNYKGGFHPVYIYGKPE